MCYEVFVTMYDDLEIRKRTEVVDGKQAVRSASHDAHNKVRTESENRSRCASHDVLDNKRMQM